MVSFSVALALLASTLVGGSPLGGSAGDAVSVLDVRNAISERSEPELIKWRGVLEPGKPMVYLSGATFEDIDKQAKALDPSYTIFQKHNASRVPYDITTGSADDGAVGKRQTGDIFCDRPVGLNTAEFRNSVWDGVNYLWSVGGECAAPAGPWSCAAETCTGGCRRQACAWNSAIYMCNDNPWEHYEPCAWVADVAAAIIRRCEGGSSYPYYPLKGEARDARRWYTVVGRSPC